MVRGSKTALADRYAIEREMGDALQTQITALYFGRYIETMQKLQAIVMNLPIQST